LALLASRSPVFTVVTMRRNSLIGRPVSAEIWVISLRMFRAGSPCLSANFSQPLPDRRLTRLTQRGSSSRPW
jgi:hypothetical protein